RESPAAELEPWHDLSRLNDLELQRSLGLAYFDRSLEAGPHTEFCIDRGRRLLEGVRARGLQEGQVSAALAQILSQTRGADAAPIAAEALHDSELPAASRIRSLYILATDHYRNQRPVQAIELLQELIRLRRCSADWALLGFCELARADSRPAV